MSLELLCLDGEDRTPQQGNIGWLIEGVSAANGRKEPKTKAEISEELWEHEVKLTPTQLAVFSQLYNNRSRIVTREDIDINVWPELDSQNLHRLYMNITRINSKIKQAGVEAFYVILNYQGVGYSLRINDETVSNRQEQEPAEYGKLRAKPLHEAGSREELYQILDLNGFGPIPKSVSLFWALLQRKERFFGKTQLISEVWGVKEETDYPLYARSLVQTVYRLRKTVEAWQINGFNYEVDYARGIGYRISIRRADNPQAQPRSEAR